MNKFEQGIQMFREGVCYSDIHDSEILQGYTFEERMSRCGMYYSQTFKHSSVTGSEIHKSLKQRGINLA